MHYVLVRLETLHATIRFMCRRPEFSCCTIASRAYISYSRPVRGPAIPRAVVFRGHVKIHTIYKNKAEP